MTQAPPHGGRERLERIYTGVYATTTTFRLKAMLVNMEPGIGESGSEKAVTRRPGVAAAPGTASSGVEWPPEF